MTWVQSSTFKPESAAMALPPVFRALCLEIHALGDRAIDQHVDPRREGRARAGQEYRRRGDLLRRRHAAGRIALDHRLEEPRHIGLHVSPDAALEEHRARRDHVAADLLSGVLTSPAPGIVD